MRWSTAFIPTLRDDPAEAEAPSHRLLLRAGFIRQLMAGHYSLLPLAVRVRRRIMDVIREEHDRFGAQEVLMPTMHPAEIWKQSGRWDVMGDNLFRLKDRKGQDMALGMTHEEIVTNLSLGLQSYKDLPQIWYQFQTKFRDEARPKSGLMRVREFTMKDSYSFDLDQAGLDKSYGLHRDAYIRIFERLGVQAMPVEASNGSMGGNASTEFMAPSQSGEDDVIHCVNCGYAANVEKAISALAPVEDGPGGTLERFDTPGVRTIAALETFDGGAAADRQIKTLVYVIDDRLTLVLLRGDHELMEQKLIDFTAAVTLRPAQAEEIKAALGASPGSLGAVGVSDLPILADSALQGRSGMVTGANTDDVHLRNVDVQRDIEVQHWTDLRRAQAEEPCSNCGTPLSVVRAMEVGHIFQLGYKFTDALGVSVLGPDGSTIKPIMGSYGIGVERAISAIVEQHHDDKGIVWPESVAPFDVAIAVLDPKDATAAELGERYYAELQSAGVEVILDDRDARPGVKLKDIELIGIPRRITIGKRGLANGVVEVTTRRSGETVELAVDEAVGHVIGARSH